MARAHLRPVLFGRPSSASPLSQASFASPLWPAVFHQRPSSARPLWPVLLSQPSLASLLQQPASASPIQPALFGQPSLASPLWPESLLDQTSARDPPRPALFSQPFSASPLWPALFGQPSLASPLRAGCAQPTSLTSPLGPALLSQPSLASPLWPVLFGPSLHFTNRPTARGCKRQILQRGGVILYRGNPLQQHKLKTSMYLSEESPRSWSQGLRPWLFC